MALLSRLNLVFLHVCGIFQKMSWKQNGLNLRLVRPVACCKLKPNKKVVKSKFILPPWKVVMAVRQYEMVALVRQWMQVPCDGRRCSHHENAGSCKFLCNTTRSRPTTHEKEVFAGTRDECDSFAIAFRAGKAMAKPELRQWLLGRSTMKNLTFKGMDIALRFGFMNINRFLADTDPVTEMEWTSLNRA